MTVLDLSRWGVTVPASYTAMSAAGVVGYGPSLEEWRASWRTLALTAPPALSWLDLEWLMPEHISAEATSLSGRSAWRRKWPASFTFVAFAQTGGGDEWGWAPTLAAPDATEPPVIYVEHDSDDARIVAPTFASFVFRMALEGLATILPNKAWTVEDNLRSIHASVNRTLPYLEEKQAKRLARTLTTPLRERRSLRLKEWKEGAFVGVDDGVEYGYGWQQGAYLDAKALLAYPRFDEALPHELAG
jgi:hypothetical protein